MNIQKMNEKMMELEERMEVETMKPSEDMNKLSYLTGMRKGFLTAMELLGYRWMGQLNGGFRRDRQA